MLLPSMISPVMLILAGVLRGLELASAGGNEPEHFLATCGFMHGLDMSSVQLGYECWNKIETPFSKKLLELDDCSKGSGCQPPIDDVQKLIILGSGPAGLSAAIYAARANLDPLVVSVDGGQLEGTSEVENYPGVDNKGCDNDSSKSKLQSISGSAIVQTFNTQARAFGTRFVQGWVEQIVGVRDPPFEVRLEGGRVLRANALIVATGANTRWLGMESEKKYQSNGVSSCATCDGFFFRNQRVAVIGGGDSAMEEALFLSRICTKVTVIHRRDTFAATSILVDQVIENPKITVLWSHVVHEFYGEDGENLSKVIAKDVKTGNLVDVEVEGAFVAIGHSPNTELFRKSWTAWYNLTAPQRRAATELGLSEAEWPPVTRKGQAVELDEEGYIVTQRQTTATSVPGIFAAGDVADNIYRQAITSAGSGAMAALDAERWLCRLGC